LLVHQQIIWMKARAVLTHSHFMWQHERPSKKGSDPLRLVPILPFFHSRIDARARGLTPF
jgi:hypothetical protein